MEEWIPSMPAVLLIAISARYPAEGVLYCMSLSKNKRVVADRDRHRL
jgi:hypothetical protein